MKKLVGQGKPFHSAIDKAAGMMKRKAGTGAEFMKELMGIPGIKQTEIQERGLGEVLGMPRMTHDQFMANLAIRPAPAVQEKVLGGDRSNPDSEAPYHGNYTLPGGENYREMLIKAPKGVDNQEKIMELEAKLRRIPMFNSTPEQQADIAKYYNQVRELKAEEDVAPKPYRGVLHHFGGEPGILASMRLKDRTGPSGEKLLHLEELQSDWHQEGRDKGYTTLTPKELEELRALTRREVEEDGLLPHDMARSKELEAKIGEVPNAPFKKNWEEMALKRLIHHAAEKGYHGIVVTPGQEQADRYPRREETEKLAQEKGMKSFYDSKVPNILNSIGKRYGVKTQLHGMPLAKKGRERTDEEFIEALRNDNLVNADYFRLPEEAKDKYSYHQENVGLHHFPITEEMRKDVLTNGLPLYNKGGTVHMADGGNMDQMQLEMMNKQLGMYKAAERAKAGRMAAEAIKKEPQMKASEALGQLREKGFKRTTTTQSDRTRVGGGNIGGANFSALSSVDPEYANKVWGVMDTGTASRLTNLTNPETAWTTMLGSEHQLKSNPIVFDKLRRQFQAAMKQGLLSPELEAKINHNLALTFGEGANIRDPQIWKMANTFEKRRALGELMMGQGIPPKKGGVALGGEKSGKGVIFQPTQTLMQETEPSLLHPEHGGDIPTFAAGPRLFQLEKATSYRPDLHPGFPMLIHGQDLGKRMKPVPTEAYLPDWHKAFRKANPHRKKPGYYDLALGMEGQGLPSQELTDAYLRHLIMEGFKRGGAVRMADGGQVDIKNIGVNEAPDMDVKSFFPPRPATSGILPVGGIQQPPQPPQQMQQPPQAPQGMPQGQAPFQPPQAPPMQPPSNILQMTRQGQAMNAIRPPQMARGGRVDRDTMMFELMNRKPKVKHG